MVSAAEVWAENKAAILTYIIPIPVCFLLNSIFSRLFIIPKRPSLVPSAEAALGIGLSIAGFVGHILFILEANEKHLEGLNTLPILIAASFFLCLNSFIAIISPLLQLQIFTTLWLAVITVRTCYQSLHAMAAARSPTCLSWTYSRLMRSGVIVGILFEDIPQFIISLIYTINFELKGTSVGLAVIACLKILYTIYTVTQIRSKQIRKDVTFQLSLSIIPRETPRFAYTTLLNHNFTPDEAFQWVVEMALDGSSNVEFPEGMLLHPEGLLGGIADAITGEEHGEMLDELRQMLFDMAGNGKLRPAKTEA
ncbi:hypothetical protein HDV00_012065 [Rhizophlyctis rosea]|nr:hypothetical protein HDV00_012065 [Rhizophlyctis rosea]